MFWNAEMIILGQKNQYKRVITNSNYQNPILLLQTY